MRLRLHLTYALLFLSASAAGQNQPCEVDVPLNIVMPNGALVRGIQQDGFVARHGNDVVLIRSVDADTAPRRIVVVVENGKNVNPAARKVEASVLGAFVRNVRAEDSVAFLTAVGPRQEVRFSAPREELLSAVGELSSPAKGKGQGNSALNAVLEAAGWLQPIRPGDSIILVAMGLERGEAAYRTVGKTLTAAGVRLFGFQLGTFYAGIYYVGVTNGPRGGLLPSATIDSNRETMFGLADETGGFFLEENTEGEPQRSYHLTDERLRQLDELEGQLYKAIVGYYRIRLAAPPDGLAIDLSDSVRRKLSEARLVYPRKVPSCSPASPANPAPAGPSMK